MLPVFEPSTVRRGGTAVYTCRTQGCEFQNMEIPYLFWVEIDGTISAICGGCQNPHTEMRILDGPYELPRRSE